MRQKLMLISMSELQTTLPVFKVRSTILMPHAQLPIVMNEQEYVSVAMEAVENNVVAVIQPQPVFINSKNDKVPKKSYNTGCAGRITNINPIGNGMTITVYGLCRFEVVKEISPDVAGTSRVVVNYDKYLVDMEEPESEHLEFDKQRLMDALDRYFRRLEISPNWREIRNTPGNVLISALAMACPFHPSEKQSLLETVDFKERSDMITRMIEINSYDRYNTASTVN